MCARSIELKLLVRQKLLEFTFSNVVEYSYQNAVLIVQFSVHYDYVVFCVCTREVSNITYLVVFYAMSVANFVQ